MHPSSIPSANLEQARQLVESQAWAPSFTNAFRLIFAVRCAAALYSILSDCDEVFNYWEPTHWLQYGFGLQTWEYSPEFAIRSWSYISFHAILGWIGSWFAKSKVGDNAYSPRIPLFSFDLTVPSLDSSVLFYENYVGCHFSFC